MSDSSAALERFAVPATQIGCYVVGALRRSGRIPPGTYTVRVTSTGLTAYHLRVDPTPWTVLPDRFERNDTFDTATVLRFQRTPLDIIAGHGPGTFDLTLHDEFRNSDTLPWAQKRWMDRDYFVFDAPARQGRASVDRAHL